ncbi:Lrp/AsnC family transcriptional regulator [Maritimibacter dapengensis]|uniref:siroheme decarboxylase n=1 Tax=Maritimibacter dapengensis TaxID=2836868 RepID=A0ABS6T0Z2_9RHOB|nr:AsnC family transcriptional regulator [Maritimibacter dapengensis]MBV7378891.1 AsnC family transcriptional regulator [Maritimibacter dapengensis]
MRRTALAPDALDATDRKLINRLQDGITLTAHPFAAVAQEFDLAEADVIDRIARMRDIGAATRFGPFIDAAAMGGAFCLCAMHVPEDDFERVMTLVNDHPEVAHNYERVHHLNMWFVLATDTPEGIDETADRIEAETGLTVMRFPKLKEFFIGFRVTA